MIQRFYYVGNKTAFLSIDHVNHVYNYYTNRKDVNEDADYINVPLKSLIEVLDEIKKAGYTESNYQL